MSTDSTIVRSAAERMAVAFDMDDPCEALSADATPEALMAGIRAALVDGIIRLLSGNPERLMTILYRIDVDERRVNTIFTTALPPDMPELLADLVIERQLAKAVYRAQYRNAPPEP